MKINKSTIDTVNFKHILDICFENTKKFCTYVIEKDSIEEFLFGAEMYFYFLFVFPSYISSIQECRLEEDITEHIITTGLNELQKYTIDKFNINLDNIRSLYNIRFEIFLKIFSEYTTLMTNNTINTMTKEILYMDSYAKYDQKINNFFSNDYRLFLSKKIFFSEENSYTSIDLDINRDKQSTTLTSRYIDSLAYKEANLLISQNNKYNNISENRNETKINKILKKQKEKDRTFRKINNLILNTGCILFLVCIISGILSFIFIYNDLFNFIFISSLITLSVAGLIKFIINFFE